jgi:hypothetical protein
VGACIGVLSCVTFVAMGKALGASTTFVRAAALVEAVFVPDHVAETAYFRKYAIDRPAVDWQMMLVVGLFAGALISARLSRSVEVEHVPDLWASRFGPSPVLRYAAAFVGGALVLFGARLAGGCPTGHGVSGGLQLALGSWAFFPAMFLGGVGMAFLLFGRKGRHHV